MPSPLRAFGPREPAVLSLSVLAASPRAEFLRSHFEVLVRHLLHRFFHNDLMATEEETSRAMLLGYMAALPGMLVALYLFPSYHAYPIRRTFWPQVSDHYFCVTYSLVVMGIVTVYEWDLLFPDLLDVFVLSSLPVPTRRLFLARITAIAIFLGLVQFGTSFPGFLFLPAVADLPHTVRHFAAHFIAVTASGVFASALALAFQGVLLNLFGANAIRRILPFVQALAIAALFTLLFLFPLVSQFLRAILNSGSPLVGWFPLFWFLGIYERILGGSSTLPIFTQLATTGGLATLATIVLVQVTYPLAYRRRVRQLVEGPGTTNRKLWSLPLGGLLNAILLRTPGERATFHFVSQTLLRIRRHRVILAMYGGVGVAITIADMLLLRVEHSRIRVGFSMQGVRSAVPVIVFWTVTALRTGITAPINLRASWIFRVITGRPTLQHLNGARLWVAMWSLILSLSAIALLRGVVPVALDTSLFVLGRILVALGCSLLLTDTLLLNVLAVPFTELRKTSISDLPLAVLRYLFLFPIGVLTVVRFEQWLEMRPRHLAEAILLIAGVHLGLRWIFRRRVEHLRMGSDFGDTDTVFQQIGLMD